MGPRNKFYDLAVFRSYPVTYSVTSGQSGTTKKNMAQRWPIRVYFKTLQVFLVSLLSCS